MAHLYDLMLLIDASAPDDRRQAIVGEVESMLGSGGEIVGRHDWGSRRDRLRDRPSPGGRLPPVPVQERAGAARAGQPQPADHRRGAAPPDHPAAARRAAPPPSPEPPQAAREEEPEGRVAARAAADAPPSRRSQSLRPSPRAPAEPAAPGDASPSRRTPGAPSRNGSATTRPKSSFISQRAAHARRIREYPRSSSQSKLSRAREGAFPWPVRTSTA